MVQSLNTKALAALAYVIRHPTVLVPHVSVSNVSELNYRAMKENAGVRGKYAFLFPIRSFRYVCVCSFFL